MPTLEWLKAFELRVPEIDGDHRTMLDLMNAVQSAVATGDRERGTQYLDRLLVISKSHFEREEALLRSWNFPDTATHAKYHLELLERAITVRREFAEVDTPGAFEECCEELLSFLLDDVVRGDLKLKSFLEDAGLALPV